MNTKLIYPRKRLMVPKPTPEPTPSYEGVRAGRLAGVLVSAILWALLVLGFFIAFLNPPVRDYVAIASIGAGASLIFSFPFIFK